MSRLASIGLAGTILCAALLPTVARGQRTQRITAISERWMVEGGVSYSLLENDEVIVARGRGGKQFNESLFIGGTASLLLRDAETRRRNGYDRISDLLYAGPTIEYSDVFRGRVRYYFGLTVAIGAIGYESAAGGVVTDHSGVFAGVEPEIGLLVRVGRRRIFQVRTSIGGMVGTILGSDITVYTAPAATFGMRVPLPTGR